MSAVDPNGSPVLVVGGGGASLPTDDASGLLSGAPPNTFVVVDPVGNGALATFAQTWAAITPRCSLGTSATVGTSTTACAQVTGTPSAAPTLAAGQSCVMLIHPVATPSGAETIASHMDSAASTRGWIISAGYNTGDYGELSLFFKGLLGGGAFDTIPLTGATFAGALNAPHVIAFSCLVNGTFRYSWDGGAVQSIAAPSGTYAPPISGDPLMIGLLSGPVAPAASVQTVCARWYSTVLSDADLVAVAATRSDYRLAAPSSGTLVASFDAAWFAGPRTFRDPADTSRRWTLEGAIYLHERAP